MSPDLALERAKRAREWRPRIRYKLGRGGRQPLNLSPAQDRYLDCSGFVMWCLGLDRKEGNFWWNTDSILHDALHERHRFQAIPVSVPGAVVVYGAGGKIGHIGLVTEPGKAVHCSPGNQRDYGQAIWETSDALFRRHPDFVYAWPLAYGPLLKSVP